MFTPAKLAQSGTEDGHQTALFAWANMARLYGFEAAEDDLCYTQKGYAKERYSEYEGIEALEMMFAIPNGGKRDKITAARLKATGVRAGYPDIALDYPTDKYAGLRIELKRPASADKVEGTVTDAQRKWLVNLTRVGFAAVKAVGWIDAKIIIKEYLDS